MGRRSARSALFKGQLRDLVREALFSPVFWGEALYAPPFRRKFFVKSAPAIERIGSAIGLPFAGVHIVEATKQVYRPVKRAPSRAPPARGAQTRARADGATRRAGLNIPSRADWRRARNVLFSAAECHLARGTDNPMTNASPLLVLLRHGQSEWNLKNLFTGWKDPDLTPLGVEEAKAAGQRLKARGLAFDLCFTSASRAPSTRSTSR